MFWVVTTSASFCGISLADILLRVSTYQHPWTYWKSKTTRGVFRTLGPRKKNRYEKLRDMSSPSILHHLHYRKWRMTRSVGWFLWGSIKTSLCSCFTNSEGATNKFDVESVPYMNPETFGATKHPSVSNIALIESIVSLSPHELGRYTDEQIHDIQFSPDGEWIAVCSTVNCYAIHVRSEVSSASNIELYGITKKMCRLDILQLGVNDLPIPYDK